MSDEISRVRVQLEELIAREAESIRRQINDMAKRQGLFWDGETYVQLTQEDLQQGAKL